MRVEDVLFWAAVEVLLTACLCMAVEPARSAFRAIRDACTATGALIARVFGGGRS